MRKLVTILVAAIVALSVSSSGFAADTKAPLAKPGQAMKEMKAMPMEAGKAAVVDINSATEAELKSIPGIGDAYSKKIIAGRPYAKKDQLVSKKILPKGVYEKIKDKIVAKQAKK